MRPFGIGKRALLRYEFEMTWNDVLQVQYRAVEKVA